MTKKLTETYEAQIRKRFPEISRWDMALRVQLMAHRDRADAGLSHCSPEAWTILSEAARLCRFAALDDRPRKALLAVLFAAQNLIAAAQHMQDATRQEKQDG